MKYFIFLQPSAVESLTDVRDRRIQEQIRDRIDGLAHEPDKQGKPLTGELRGYRSLRAVGQRYRIIYKVEKTRVVVMIVAIGIRKEGDKKDIYVLAKKLLKLRLI